MHEYVYFFTAYISTKTVFIPIPVRRKKTYEEKKIKIQINEQNLIGLVGHHQCYINWYSARTHLTYKRSWESVNNFWLYGHFKIILLILMKKI